MSSTPAPSQKNHSARLGTDPILPLLVKLSIPGIIGMATQALYNVVDSIYIGRLSKEALSALSLAFPIQMVLIALAVGTGVGGTSLIARTLGQGKKEKAGNAAEHVLLMGVILGLTAAVTGALFARPLIGLFTQDAILLDPGSRYIRIIMMGSLMMFAPMVSNGILRGEGNTFIPMVTMIIGALLNILLDPFLIFGWGPFPALGVEGAAWATILSRVISGTFVLRILFSKGNEIQLRPALFRFNPQLIKEIYQVGAPAMAMQLLASVMLAGGNLILAAFSTTAIAVFGVFFRLQSFIFMPVFGLGQGIMPLTGYNYGAGNFERMKKVIRYGMSGAFLFTLTGFLIFQIFPRQLITLFNNDPEMIAIGTTALRRISIGFLFVGPSLTSANLFQAIGRGLPSLVVGIARTIVVLLPAMALLGHFFGLDALWFAFPLAEGCTFAAAMIWLTLLFRKIFRHE